MTRLEERRARARDMYGAAIGRRREDLPTPALVLDLPAAERNIARMGKEMEALPTVLRPHIKVHKSPELALRQVAAGAVGVCVATVWEALVMAEAGISDIFLVNTVVQPEKLTALAALARRCRLQIAVDSVQQVQWMAAAARAAGAQVAVLIEVDTGMDRAGVDDWTSAVEVAREIARHGELWLEGVTGYEGHCSLEDDPSVRATKQHTAMALLVGVADELERHGFRCPVRSAGGTATWDLTATAAGITEVQAGTYVVMDNFHGAKISGFEQALFVTASVISRTPDRVILDAGSKSVGTGGGPTIVGHPLPVVRFDEEHGIFAAASGDGPALGETVELVPGYAPATVNMYDVFHVVEDDRVVDIWPVTPRGPGHQGLLAR